MDALSTLNEFVSIMNQNCSVLQKNLIKIGLFFKDDHFNSTLNKDILTQFYRRNIIEILLFFKDDHLNSSLNKEILTLFHVFLSNKIEFKVNSTSKDQFLLQ